MNYYSKKIVRDTRDAGRSVIVISKVTDWVDAPNTSPDLVDNVILTRVPYVTDLADATSRLIYCSEGTTILIRLKYDDGVTGVTDPIIQVLGIDALGNFHWLINNTSASKTATLATAVDEDVLDGTYQYTEVGGDQIFDLQGCSQCIIFSQTAFAGTGDVTTSAYQYKIT